MYNKKVSKHLWDLQFKCISSHALRNFMRKRKGTRPLRY